MDIYASAVNLQAFQKIDWKMQLIVPGNGCDLIRPKAVVNMK